MSEKPRRRSAGSPAPTVHSISDAQEAASLESRRRLRSYGLKMLLRAVLMIAGAVVAATWNLWVGLGLLAASAVIPWLAVVDANVIDTRESDAQASYVDGPPLDALSAGQGQEPNEDSAEAAPAPGAAGAGAGSEEDVILGSWDDGSSMHRSAEQEQARQEPQPGQEESGHE